MKMEEVIGEVVVRKKSFDISCYISSCIFLLTAALTSKDRIYFIVLTGFGLTLSYFADIYFNPMRSFAAAD
jgi:hypothetical protein